MFNIGDKIVYPMYGAGVIESIEEKEVLGIKKKYYIMRLPIDNMKVMIPLDSMEDFRIRSVISYEEYKNIIDIFKKHYDGFLESWSKRYRSNMEKIKNGDIYGVAEVVKELMLREVKKGLSTGEKRILESAERILYSELMLVSGMEFESIKSIIKDALLKQ